MLVLVILIVILASMLMLLPAQQGAEAVLFVDVLDVDVVVNDIVDIVLGVAIDGDFVSGATGHRSRPQCWG